MKPEPNFTDQLKHEQMYGYGAYIRRQAESPADQFARRLDSVVGVDDLMTLLNAGYDAGAIADCSDMMRWLLEDEED